jgi:transcriptional regulator with XRE-family HTH domain
MLNETLKSIRLFHRYSQTDLAHALGVSKSQISEIESGVRNPSSKVLKNYSDFFDIPLSSIYFLSEKLEDRNKAPKIAQKVIDIVRWITSDDSCTKEKNQSPKTKKNSDVTLFQP